MTELTSEQIKEVPCHCGARVGEACKEDGTLIVAGFHKDRIQLRETFPALPLHFDATDKTIVMFYAFCILCEAVAKKSVEMLGKSHSAHQIQIAFIQEAIKQARDNGFIGPACDEEIEPIELKEPQQPNRAERRRNKRLSKVQ